MSARAPTAPGRETALQPDPQALREKYLRPQQRAFKSMAALCKPVSTHVAGETKWP